MILLSTTVLSLMLWLQLGLARSMRMRTAASLFMSISTGVSAATSTTTCSDKLKGLRELMKESAIDVFVVPTDDPHMSEYTADYFNRREFISGFTGSAGTAVITHEKALLFTDGRYHNQASLELSNEWTLMKVGVKDVPTLSEYLHSNLSAATVIGVDPLLHSAASYIKMKDTLTVKNISLKSVESNLIDKVWGGSRPAAPAGKLRVHPLEYAGKSVKDKLNSIREALNGQKAYGLVSSSLDEIMWLFNIRGADVPCNPVAVSYAIVTLSEAVLYVDGNKLSFETIEHLNANGVVIDAYDNIIDGIKYESRKGKIWFDSRTVNFALFDSVGADKRVDAPSPIILAKAVKNQGELAGMRACHERDGAAVAEFLCWLEKEIASGRTVSEYDIDLQLTARREAAGLFVDRSFPTIAGVNSNGAIIHYRAAAVGCKQLTKDDMLLLDSGGQYQDGTTDVTRTLHLGTPSAIQKEMYTRVLKGHIAVDSKIFPTGTAGCQLDSFAREHLWNIGKDYIHGTGHGVGAALNVHEGPHRISRVIDSQPLLPGMIVSNEPGYYEDGNYGIRIENLLEVVEKPSVGDYGGRGFLGFDKLTYIPIQTKLMEMSLLTVDEKKWINDYHDQVRARVTPHMKSAEGKTWLLKNTEHI